MGLRRVVLAVCLVTACSSSSHEPAPAPVLPGTPAPTPAPAPAAMLTPLPSAAPAPEPVAPPPDPAEVAAARPRSERPVGMRPAGMRPAGMRPAGNGAGCNADQRHCCQPDGTLVAVGCCGGALPAHCRGSSPDRNADGTCRPCTRRCLAQTARIDTPRGAVPVASLTRGDVVWTLDHQRRRVAAPVETVVSLSIERAHELAVITLDDGRVARASPAHPTADGRTLAELAPGDMLDGAVVLHARRVPYDGDATWDLRPEGVTGVYWADGVLLGSTL
ncbi:MAG: Hint domain-containing protein [Deltaproteobacteria bacterium]|nr:Hint domain-containing protein [Deltaproteobacteria bacterium]